MSNEGTLRSVSEMRAEFSQVLEEAMKNKETFSPEIHLYLTDVMMKYAQWKDAPLSPGVHTRQTEPFALQIMNGPKQGYAHSIIVYEHQKSIGETILFAVSCWPESISSTPVRERPSIDYYADAGSVAYSKASEAAERTSLSQEVSKVMTEMSRGFRRYAATLYETVQEMGDSPKRDVKLLITLAALFGDDGPIRRFVLKRCEKSHEHKLIIH
jgi:hypothetical protein